MKSIAIIPARMGSSRFPGKPMALISGVPMIGHVYNRVSQSSLLDLTVVATCDKIIYNYITSIGGTAIMTSDNHERASDRCAEALLKIEKNNSLRFDFVVMVQGDEPLTHPNMIQEALDPMFNDSSIDVVNLMGVINSQTEHDDKNCIKVVCDRYSNAIYFSREPIPTRSKIQNVKMYKQVCIIPFRRDFLIEYTNLEPTPLEIAESIDMLRILEHGKKIRMVVTNFISKSVDIPNDLLEVEKLISESGFE